MMRQALEAMRDRRGAGLMVTCTVASPPPGSNPAGARLPTALRKLPRRGQRRELEDLLRKQFLLAPKLWCLWSHPAGLLPVGSSIESREFTQIQEHEFDVHV